MDASAEAVGFLASAGSLSLWWPQAVRLWRQRRDGLALRGISIPTQVVLLATESLWATYAVLTGSFWVGAPAVVNIPLSILALVVLRRARRAERTGRTGRTAADAECREPAGPETRSVLVA